MLQTLRARVASLAVQRPDSIQRADLQAFMRVSGESPREAVLAARAQLEALAQKNQLTEALGALAGDTSPQ